MDCDADFSASWNGLVTFLAFIWSLYFAEMALGVEVQHYPAHTIIGNAGYVFFGMLVIVFSKADGAPGCRGLD